MLIRFFPENKQVDSKLHTETNAKDLKKKIKNRTTKGDLLGIKNMIKPL